MGIFDNSLDNRTPMCYHIYCKFIKYFTPGDCRKMLICATKVNIFLQSKCHGGTRVA